MIRQENGNWVAYCDSDCGASVNTGPTIISASGELS
jgi:hypothetical protein